MSALIIGCSTASIQDNTCGEPKRSFGLQIGFGIAIGIVIVAILVIIFMRYKGFFWNKRFAKKTEQPTELPIVSSHVPNDLHILPKYSKKADNSATFTVPQGDIESGLNTSVTQNDPQRPKPPQYAP